MLTAALQLVYNGVTAIPVPGLQTQGQRRQARADLQDTIAHFPEFNPEYVALEGEPLVWDGMGALGTPSSFHNPFVRHLRLQVHMLVWEVMQFMVQLPTVPMCPLVKDKVNFCQEVDRLMVRPAGCKPPAREWHYDPVNPDFKPRPNAPQDMLFGGWLNFDDVPHTFPCLVNELTTKDISGALARHERGSMGALHDPRQALLLSPTAFSVPPGHLLVFANCVLHAVEAETKAYCQHRLFMGWRLTFSSQPLCASLDKQLDTMAPVTLKTGEAPEVYSPEEKRRHPDKVLEFLQRAFTPQVLHSLHSRKQGSRGHLPSPRFPSLKTLHLEDAYKPYTKVEKDILHPHPLFPA